MNNAYDLLCLATKKLKFDGARFDAEVLLSHSLNISRVELLVNIFQDVSESIEHYFLQLICKRLSGMPVAKIIGKKEFWSLDFFVNSDVLDPRPDTETIMEILLKLKLSRKKFLKIADFGSGSGCLSVAIAREFRFCKIFAFEKSAKAYRVMCGNIRNYGYKSRIFAYNMDWNKCNTQFDIIVSNPPYIDYCALRELSVDVKNFDPMMALYGGFSGLNCYRELFLLFKKRLSCDGVAIVELGESCHRYLLHYARRCGFVKSYFVNDLSGSKRCLVLKGDSCAY